MIQKSAKIKNILMKNYNNASHVFTLVNFVKEINITNV